MMDGLTIVALVVAVAALGLGVTLAWRQRTLKVEMDRARRKLRKQESVLDESTGEFRSDLTDVKRNIELTLQRVRDLETSRSQLRRTTELTLERIRDLEASRSQLRRTTELTLERVRDLEEARTATGRSLGLSSERISSLEWALQNERAELARQLERSNELLGVIKGSSSTTSPSIPTWAKPELGLLPSLSDESEPDAAAIVRPLIQSLWIGDRLSTMERLCITSFLEHGHPFHLYVYDEVANVPRGVILEDATEILPRDKIFRYKEHDSVSGFSNLFRYKLLLERGSYWVDTDEICLTPFPSEPEYVFASEAVQREKLDALPKPPRPNGNVLKAPPGSEIFGYCFEAASRRNSDDLVWGETGPKLLSEAVEKFGLRDFVSDYRDYCPVDWWQFQRLVQPDSLGALLDELRMARHKPHGIHLWHEMWRRNSLDKDAEYPQSSIYEHLKRRYDVNVSRSGPRAAETSSRSDAH